MHVVVTTTQLRFAAMHRVRQRDLPFEGHSHDFGGADHGDTQPSGILFDGPPGSGPKPHRHPYYPLVLGEGKRLFDGDTKAIELDLLSASTTQKGVTLLTYGRR
jgi:hypothetical protein